ncbi:MAG TPA: AbrB/MazE/SpoVT family DNA-binding domain-containing protein [Hansschlegelia sp.]
MVALKLSKHGNSTGVVLPKDVLTRMKLAAGDTVYLTETQDGYRLTPYAPEFEEQMTVARRIMKTHRDVLRELAK